MGGALEARQIDAADGKLISETTGEIELEGGVMVVRRIHVHYKLRVPESARETVERLHALHADKCPIARSIRAAIDVSTSFEILAG